MAGLGVYAVLRYDDLLHRVRVRGIAVLVSQTDGAAIHLKIVLQVRASAQIDAVRRPGVVRHRLAAGIGRGWREKRQLERIPVDARDLRGHLRIQREILVAGVELNRHRGFGDGNAFLHRTRFHDDIHGNVAAHLHNDVLLDDLAEARRLHRDGVRARVHQIKDIKAGFTGLADRRNARFQFRSVTVAPATTALD